MIRGFLNNLQKSVKLASDIFHFRKNRDECMETHHMILGALLLESSNARSKFRILIGLRYAYYNEPFVPFGIIADASHLKARAILKTISIVGFRWPRSIPLM